MTSRRNDESGASLLLVIIFVMVFSVVSAAILDLANTGFRATSSISNARDSQLRFEGAVEGAINAVRSSNSAGFTNQPCPSFNQNNVTVTCTGVGSSTGGVNDAFPEYAVLALGSGAADGIRISQNGEATIDGGIHSNTVVSLTNPGTPLLRVFGDVRAVGNCTPDPDTSTSIIATGSVRCANAGVAAPAEADPGYPAEISSISGLAADPVPTCSGGVVQFAPGLYSESPPALASAAGCSGSTYWFTTGVYYFDFNSTWTYSQVIRAGTTSGSSDTCSAGGVQFIVGGETLFEPGSGSGPRLLLCGGPSPTTQQRIAFYGLGTGARGVPVTRTAIRANIASSTSVPAFSNPNNAKSRSDGGATADASLQKNETAVLTLDDFLFSGGPPVPPGATVTSAQLRITTTAVDGNTTASVTVNVGNGDRSCGNFSTGTSTCNLLTSSRLTTTAEWRGLQDMVVTYTASRNNGGPNTAQLTRLDGIELEVTYTPPGFEAHRCPTSDASCAILDLISGNNTSRISNGTIYAPTARVNVEAFNDDTTALSRGVIARAVYIEISSSSKQTDPPISLGGQDGARVVLFEAHDDLDGGTVKLRARVSYDDTPSPDGGGTLPGKNVTVLDWAYIR